MLTHDNLASNAHALLTTLALHRDDVLLHALPIFHTHGLFVATNLVLLSRRGDDLHAANSIPTRSSRFMPRATAMMGVPTFYTACCRIRG